MWTALNHATGLHDTWNDQRYYIFNERCGYAAVKFNPEMCDFFKKMCYVEKARCLNLFKANQVEIVLKQLFIFLNKVFKVDKTAE